MPTTDSDFERTFADLAFSSLRDRAPSLFDYLVGFQVLDSNEDQTHAVGVFGCHVGDEWVYLPVFFHNGELKGHELMYLKNQDMFVPLQENWTTYVLNRKPYVLGEPSDVTHRQLAQYPPDFTSFAYSPSSWNKSASASRVPCWRAKHACTWSEPFRTAWTKSYGVANEPRYKEAAERLDLGNFIRAAGPTVARIVAAEMAKHASTLGELICKHYDPATALLADQYSPEGWAMDQKIRGEKRAMDPLLTAALTGAGSGLVLGGLHGYLTDPEPSLRRSLASGIIGAGIGGTLGAGVGAYRDAGAKMQQAAQSMAGSLQDISGNTKAIAGNVQQVADGKPINANVNVPNSVEIQFGKKGEAKEASTFAADEPLPGMKVNTHINGQPPRNDVDGRKAFKVMSSHVVNPNEDPDAAKLLKKANDPAGACEPQASKPENDVKDTYWAKAVTGPANTSPDVQVITCEDLPNCSGKNDLSESELQRLYKGEVVIKDQRTGHAKVYNADFNRNMVSPDATGIWQMLTQGGQLEDVLVVHNPLTIGAGSATCVTAVHLAKKKAANLPTGALTVLNVGTGKADWLRYFNKLPKATTMKAGQAYVLVMPSGRGSIPFKVLHTKEGLDGLTEMWVRSYDRVKWLGRGKLAKRLSRHADITHEASSYVSDWELEHAKPGEEPWRQGRHIMLVNREGGLTIVGDTLFVPANARVQAVDSENYRDTDGDAFPEPGTTDDAYAFALEANFVSPLKVHSTGAGKFAILGEDKAAADLSYPQALKSLLVDYNLAEIPARELLKQASRPDGIRVLLGKAAQEKTADGGHSSGNYQGNSQGMPAWFNEGPGAPALPEQFYANDPLTGRPATQPQVNFRMIPELMTQPGNRQLYNPDPRLDRNPYQLAMDAGKTEQKEVIDPGVIGSLLKVVDSDALIDKYLGDMFLGMDRVGRTLFLYYQHNDAFRERYGDEDQPELEDSLKNVFKGVGDLVLKLKKKAVEPNPENDRTDVDLGPVAR